MTADIAALVQQSKPAAPGEILSTTWKLRTLKDAYAPRPPVPFVVDGLLPVASLSVVYGAPGSLKSMLLADAAVCVAAGLKWLEPLGGDDAEQGVTFATSKTAVLWIDFDNGTRRTDERFDALARARNLPEDTPLHYVSMPSPWLDASEKAMIYELAELIKRLQARLVVVDNLGLIVGDVDENFAGMAQVMGNLRWLCESTQAALVVVHHQRKGGNGDGRKGELLRGHSSIEAALDLALLVERKEGGDSITVIPTKVRGFRAADIFGAFFTYKHKAGCYDLAEARFFAEAIESAHDKETKIITNTVLEALQELLNKGVTPNQKQLREATQDALSGLFNGKPPGVNRIRGVIHAIVRSGQIVEKEGQRGAATYALPTMSVTI